MKKVLLLFVCVLALYSCGIEFEGTSDKKNDYTFTVTTLVTCSPNISGYPQKSVSVTEKKGITEQQAKDAAKLFNASSKTYSGGYTITSTMTCVYVLSKDYEAPTGSRVAL